MKFATRRLDLNPEEFGTTNGGEALWVELPVAVKEGFAKQVRDVGQDDPGGRKANAVILRLVSAWNIDDDEGKVLPLVSTMDPKKDADKIEAVIAECPLPLFLTISQAVTRTDIGAGVLGNSKT